MTKLTRPIVLLVATEEQLRALRYGLGEAIAKGRGDAESLMILLENGMGEQEG